MRPPFWGWEQHPQQLRFPPPAPDFRHPTRSTLQESRTGPTPRMHPPCLLGRGSLVRTCFSDVMSPTWSQSSCGGWTFEPLRPPLNLEQALPVPRDDWCCPLLPTACPGGPGPSRAALSANYQCGNGFMVLWGPERAPHIWSIDAESVIRMTYSPRQLSK